MTAQKMPCSGTGGNHDENLNKVLKTFISAWSAVSRTRQFIMLKIFIRMKEWKQIVSNFCLWNSFGSVYPIGGLIRLKEDSKKINCPEYIKIIITKIWKNEWTRICLQFSSRIRILLLEPPLLVSLVNLPPS